MERLLCSLSLTVKTMKLISEKKKICPNCKGSGFKNTVQKCSKCRGKGVIPLKIADFNFLNEKFRK